MKSLNELRTECGWTVKELSMKSGVRPPTIYKIEGGHHRPGETTVTLLADAFGVKITDIEWPKGFSHLGKPAQGGGRLKPNAEKRVAETCPTCHETKSLHGECFSH